MPKDPRLQAYAKVNISMSRINRILGQRWPWISAAILVVILFVSSFAEIRIGPTLDPRPLGTVEDIEQLAESQDLNVLFILIDTLRAEHMSVYGSERASTPFLERLASEGILFENQLSQSSWTKCSMASMWTGLYPARAGITRFEDVLSQDAKMPAEIFSEAGFITTGLFRNGWVEGYFGFDQGFDVYVRPTPRVPPPTARMENPTIKLGGTDEDLLDSGLEFLRIHGDERWFLYLHMMDIHEYLYDQLSAVFGSDYNDVYDNSILRTDMLLEQFLGTLQQDGYLDNTIVIIGSDHGEAFGERGEEGHARSVYRETTTVPLIVSLPFRIEGGIRVQQQTRNIDIWPTIFDILGLPSPDYETDGRSRLPAILAAGRGEPEASDTTTGIAHLDQTWGKRGFPPKPTVSVTDGPYRFVYTHAPIESLSRNELFDARSDPEEFADAGSDQPETLSRLKEIAKGYLEGEPPWSDRPDALELDEVQLNQLRALGYSVP